MLTLSLKQTLELRSQLGRPFPRPCANHRSCTGCFITWYKYDWNFFVKFL